MAEKLRSKVFQPPGPRLRSVQNPCAVRPFSYTTVIWPLASKTGCIFENIEAAPPEPTRHVRGATKGADLMYDRRRRR